MASCGTCASGLLCGPTAANVCGPYNERSSPICNADKWCWSIPTPQGNALYDAFVASSNDQWAVGTLGTAIHWDGASWSGSYGIADGAQLNGVFASGSAVFAVGEKGTIVSYKSGAWSTMTSPTTYSLGGIWGSSGTDVWAVGDAGTLLHFTAGKWTSATSPTTEALRKIWGTSATNIWAVGNGVILHYDGTNWGLTSAGANDLQDVSGSSASEVWAGGTGGILKFNGTSWSQASTAATVALWAPSAGKVWFAQTSYSSWYGNSFTVSLLEGGVVSATSKLVMPIHRIVAGLAVGDDGLMLRHDGSVSWSQLGYRADASVSHTGISGTSTSDVWLANTMGLIHWDGSSWKSVPVPEKVYPVEVHAAGPSDLWIDERNTLHRFNGSAWTTSASASFLGQKLMRGFSSSDVWLIEDDSKYSPLVVNHFDGTSWSTALTPWSNMTLTASDAWGSAANDFWVAGSGGLIHWDGSTWTSSSTTATARVHGTSKADAWAVDKDGNMTHWNGSAWSPSALPSGAKATNVWSISSSQAIAFGYDSRRRSYRFDGTTWVKAAPILAQTYYMDTRIFGLVSGGKGTAWAAAGNQVLRYNP